MVGDDEASKSTQRDVKALENMLEDVGKFF
jgi:hypothetical protein